MPIRTACSRGFYTTLIGQPLPSLLDQTDWLHLASPLEPGLDGSGEVVLVIDPEIFAIREYDVTWTMTGQACDIYRVEAADGRFETDFRFPAAVLEGSATLNVCDVALGTISGTNQRSEQWQRHCQPHSRTDRAEGFSRTFGFSLSDWAVVRAEVKRPQVDTYVYLSSVEGGADSVIDRGIGNPLWDGWVQRLLPPGSYNVDVVTDRSVVPDSFSLTISVSKTPPPPHRFKSVSAGSRHTCGLLLDGTPVCWGLEQARPGHASCRGEVRVDYHGVIVLRTEAGRHRRLLGRG